MIFISLLDEKGHILYHRECSKPVIFSCKGSAAWCGAGIVTFLTKSSLKRRFSTKTVIPPGDLNSGPSDLSGSPDTLYIQVEIHCVVGTNNYDYFLEQLAENDWLRTELMDFWEHKELLTVCWCPAISKKYLRTEWFCRRAPRSSATCSPMTVRNAGRDGFRLMTSMPKHSRLVTRLLNGSVHAAIFWISSV